MFSVRRSLFIHSIL